MVGTSIWHGRNKNRMRKNPWVRITINKRLKRNANVLEESWILTFSARQTHDDELML